MHLASPLQQTCLSRLTSRLCFYYSQLNQDSLTIAERCVRFSNLEHQIPNYRNATHTHPPRRPDHAGEATRRDSSNYYRLVLFCKPPSTYDYCRSCTSTPSSAERIRPSPTRSTRRSGSDALRAVATATYTNATARARRVWRASAAAAGGGARSSFTWARWWGEQSAAAA